MRDKLIRFLKDNHAYEEFLHEIAPFTIEDLTQRLNTSPETILEDGYMIHYHIAESAIDWRALNEKWKEKVK
jgi:hypothetical protein